MRFIHRLIPKTCAPHTPLIFVLLLFSIPFYACDGIAADFTGQVVGVLDGDTIDVHHNDTSERVRLNGIDTPEKGQDFGRRAKEFTEDLAKGKEVTVVTIGTDKYGRTIGDVFLLDGVHLNKELVKAGLAWWYCRHSSNQELKQLQIEARRGKAWSLAGYLSQFLRGYIASCSGNRCLMCWTSNVPGIRELIQR